MGLEECNVYYDGGIREIYIKPVGTGFHIENGYQIYLIYHVVCEIAKYYEKRCVVYRYQLGKYKGLCFSMEDVII